MFNWPTVARLFEVRRDRPKWYLYRLLKNRSYYLFDIINNKDSGTVGKWTWRKKCGWQDTGTAGGRWRQQLRTELDGVEWSVAMLHWEWQGIREVKSIIIIIIIIITIISSIIINTILLLIAVVVILY